MNGNAKITKTLLGYEEHGILTCFLFLEQEDSSQNFGGYSLGSTKNEQKLQLGTFWLERILKTVGANKWEDLVGMYIRVEGEEYGEIRGIGHITENKWFFPKKELEQIK